MQMFIQPGKASFLIGGQWGSEGKGAAAAWLAQQFNLNRTLPDIITTNAGAQAGHTHYFGEEKHVLFHLPSSAIFARQSRPKGALSSWKQPHIYLNAGTVIDPDVLQREIASYDLTPEQLSIHPRAAVITPQNREQSQAEGSASRKRAGVGKGVGSAIAGKVMRTQLTAGDHPFFEPFARVIDLNRHLEQGYSVMAEVPQGISLSLNHSPFYPHTTSRDCTIMQAMSDAAIHPSFIGQTLMVLRTYPIRVGNTSDGYSGGFYPDQRETSWAELGQTPEITTVSKRVRRVFTFSMQQAEDSIRLARPDVIMLTFCNYLCHGSNQLGLNNLLTGVSRLAPMAQIYTQWGPKNDNVTSYSRASGVKRAM